MPEESDAVKEARAAVVNAGENQQSAEQELKQVLADDARAKADDLQSQVDDPNAHPAPPEEKQGDEPADESSIGQDAWDSLFAAPEE